MNNKSSVYVTGIGAVTPFGVGIDRLWKKLRSGESSVCRVDDWMDVTGLKTKIGSPVKDFEPTEWFDRKRARRLGRPSQFAAVAAREALNDAGWEVNRDSYDLDAGVVIGTGIGNINPLIENHKKILDRGPGRVSPFLIPQLMPNAAAAQVAIEFGFGGPNYGTVSACASGAHAIAQAFEELRLKEVDMMVVGGVEAPLLEIAYAGFDKIKALSTRNDEPERASRPFDKERDGFVMGEGAGIMILETEAGLEKRGVEPYSEIMGVGKTADAHHVTAPREDGAGAKESMADALAEGGIGPDEVDYVNAHGTSTQLNDRMETNAIKSLLGDRAYEVPVSSNKSQFGHLVGAAGAVEAIITSLSLQKGYILPTINYENPDSECDLDYVPNEGRREDIEIALSNSFGFGGQNASILIGKV
ncbi:beta-ketoacyl-ACP synthase II [Candidatus Bipolaricaulota bacterium]|nr:beta-ketoacyl-ACP synthase II [Candidatus Bipolaricaulota bacterium]